MVGGHEKRSRDGDLMSKKTKDTKSRKREKTNSKTTDQFIMNIDGKTNKMLAKQR